MSIQTQNQRGRQLQAHGRKIRRSMTTDQRAALGRLQEAVFVLAPRPLKSLAEMLDPGGKDDWVGEEPESSELLGDHDSELEGWDDDELTDRLDSLRAVVSLVSGTGAIASPVVDPGDVYALHCSSSHCFYEPPPWMLRMRTTAFGKAVGKSIGFIAELCKWLETQKGEFLVNPSPEEYVRNEVVFDFPIVTQDGLREIIVQRMSKNAGIDKSIFSRLSDKIWLFWPDKVMPLRSLFSREFRLAWVVRGCLFDKEHQEMKSIYCDMKNMNIALNKKRKELKTTSFASMDPIERLIYLCGKVKLRTDEGLDAVLATLEGTTYSHGVTI